MYVLPPLHYICTSFIKHFRPLRSLLYYKINIFIWITNEFALFCVGIVLGKINHSWSIIPNLETKPIQTWKIHDYKLLLLQMVKNDKNGEMVQGIDT